MNDSKFSNEQMFKEEMEYSKILKTWEEDMPREWCTNFLSSISFSTNTFLSTLVGRGFVVIENSTKYPSLQRPWHIHSVPGDGYSIAYLHQYHCLYMILKAHGGLRFNHPPHDHDMERHVTHCFDYLRQSIYCAGDSALEGKSAIPGLDMTDGWGDTHVCKSQDALLKWVLDNRFSNKTGIS